LKGSLSDGSSSSVSVSQVRIEINFISFG
jgi:hypothetical protein